tara:strand:- start:440 stop:1057 length:618 start_codon:yes stop_codon:yes gene_type:complete
MTIQECCGGINSNNADITEGSTPYMIKRCLNKNEWNKNQCSSNCCDSDSYCIPTEQGGFCQNRNTNKYFRYKTGGLIDNMGIRTSTNEKQILTETEARRQYPYSHEDEFPYGRLNDVSRNQFDDRRYDRSYAQAERDIVNRYMGNQIKGTETEYKRSTEYLKEPLFKFTPMVKMIILIVILIIAISILNTVITRNKMYRFKRLFF